MLATVSPKADIASVINGVIISCIIDVWVEVCDNHVPRVLNFRLAGEIKSLKFGKLS